MHSKAEKNWNEEEHMNMIEMKINWPTTDFAHEFPMMKTAKCKKECHKSPCKEKFIELQVIILELKQVRKFDQLNHI